MQRFNSKCLDTYPDKYCHQPYSGHGLQCLAPVREDPRSVRNLQQIGLFSTKCSSSTANSAIAPSSSSSFAKLNFANVSSLYSQDAQPSNSGLYQPNQPQFPPAAHPSNTPQSASWNDYSFLPTPIQQELKRLVPGIQTDNLGPALNDHSPFSYSDATHIDHNLSRSTSTGPSIETRGSSSQTGLNRELPSSHKEQADEILDLSASSIKVPTTSPGVNESPESGPAHLSQLQAPLPIIPIPPPPPSFSRALIREQPARQSLSTNLAVNMARH